MLTPEIELECISIGDPLDGGEDPVKVVSDKFVRGRADYQCMYCLRMIPKGERHRVIRVVVCEGEWGSVRYCAECCVEQARGGEPERYGMFETVCEGCEARPARAFTADDVWLCQECATALLLEGKNE